MKKTDIAMLILIATSCAFIAFLVANQIPGLRPDPKGEKVQTAKAITPEVEQPSSQQFNDKAINPTVPTVIGGGQSQAN